ncbi:MAG: dTMP kinase [bacterium]
MSQSGTPASHAKRSLRGAFITFDGIDGCGKSTQAALLASRLRAADHAVLETREPGGTRIGQGLRTVLLDPENGNMSAHCELLLYLADRVQHLDEAIRPALARGDTVICDRYHDATVAYQRFGRELDFTPVEGFIAAEIAPTSPQLTFWLDLDVETALARIAQRQRAAGADPKGASGAPGASAQGAAETRLDRERPEFHGRVREGYAAIHREEPERVLRIDAGGDVEGIGEAVWQAMRERYDGL